MNKFTKYNYGSATAEVFMFSNGTEVSEAHVEIHVTDATMPYRSQLQAVAMIKLCGNR